MNQNKSSIILRNVTAVLAIGLTLTTLSANDVITTGGALGTILRPGAIDVDGDGTADIKFVSFGSNSGFLDASPPFGLVGNIGGPPGSGAAWVRSTSTIVTDDGVGRNEIIAPFRGAIQFSDDNWSKVHFSSGDGWVQWRFGATRSVVTPLVFVREDSGNDLSAADAAALAYPTILVTNANDSGPGSLRQAIADAADGDTVIFDSGVFNGGPEAVITLSSQISLPNKTLTINASALCGGVTLSGANATRILQNGSGGTITVRGVLFTKGLSFGAAFHNASGTVTIEGCSFEKNDATGTGGGAIWNQDRLRVINSTFTDNKADFGGAILNDNTITIINSTITGNDGNCCGGLIARGTVTLENTIIAGNTADPGVAGADINFETVVENISSTNCLIGTNNGCAPVFPVGSPNGNGDYVGEDGALLDPMLNALGRYGGPTPVRLPLPGSLAIDNGGSTDNTPARDQRGEPRPAGTADIGAVEMTWGGELAGAAPGGFGSFLDVTLPGDSIVQFTHSVPASPINEPVEQTIDNDDQTKHLNFSRLNTGIDVIPTIGSTRLVGLSLTSANDVPGRDPSTFLVLGLKASGATELIASGELPAFAGRFTRQEFFFAEASEPHTSYRVIFPTVAGAPGGNNNSMQIAEIELLGAPADRSLRIANSTHVADNGAEQNLWTLSCVTDPDKTYALEFSGDLQNWNRWASGLNPTGFRTEFGFWDGNIPSRYHRVVEE